MKVIKLQYVLLQENFCCSASNFSVSKNYYFSSKMISSRLLLFAQKKKLKELLELQSKTCFDVQYLLSKTHSKLKISRSRIFQFNKYYSTYYLAEF